MSPSEFLYTVLLRPAPLRKLANAALRAILPEMARIHGAQIALNPRDPVVSGALTLRVYEREEIAFFRRHFQPTMTLADVGANVGLYTGLALATPGFSGTILSIEPDADSRGFLEKTIAANPVRSPGGARVIDAAASDHSSRVPFFRNPENHGDNRLYADPALEESGTVPTETLDAICRQQGIKSIDFLKIDVQGAEARVLTGARNILAASPRVILMTEFWPHGLTCCGSDPQDYLRLLESAGFVLHHANGQPLKTFEQEKLIQESSGRRYLNLYGFKE